MLWKFPLKWDKDFEEESSIPYFIEFTNVSLLPVHIKSCWNDAENG